MEGRFTIIHGKFVVVDKFSRKTSEIKQNNGLFTMTAVSKINVSRYYYVCYENNHSRQYSAEHNYKIAAYEM